MVPEQYDKFIGHDVQALKQHVTYLHTQTDVFTTVLSYPHHTNTINIIASGMIPTAQVAHYSTTYLN